MDFKQFSLPLRIRSTYDRISSELDKLSDELKPESMSTEQLEEFCRSFSSAKKALDNLYVEIASHYGIKQDDIITITNGIVFCMGAPSSIHLDPTDAISDACRGDLENDSEYTESKECL